MSGIARRPAALTALVCAMALGCGASNPASAEAEHDHEEAAGEAGHAEAPRIFTAAEMEAAGIVVAPVETKPLPRPVRAPGEVKIDGYASSILSSRVAGTVIVRHAALGDRVSAGQPVLRLFSAEMAGAQSAFVLARQEYARLSGAGRNAIARKETDQALIATEEARARLLTYGLTAEAIAALERDGLPARGLGEFDLAAPQAGKLMSDDFSLGEVVEAGKPLAEIGDADAVWIEAHVGPDRLAGIAGETVRFSAGGEMLEGRILHVFPQIDEATRTVPVRIQAKGHAALRPGGFVTVEFYGPAEPVLVAPVEAVLQGPDGDWTVQVERAPGRFEAAEIELLYAVGSECAIAGIAPGTRIAVKGAFFIASEAAKSGFDAHAH